MIHKDKIKILLIIILIIFAIIPFLTIILRRFLSLEEGLTVSLKTSGENDGGIKLGLEADGASGENTQIDRIKISDGKYNYCIGDISCSSGNVVQEGTDAYMLSDSTTKVGYTYAEMCSDNTTPVSCNGSSSFSKFYGPFDGLPALFQTRGNNLLISDNVESDNAKENESDNSLKCLADNGAVVGDPLCCGQDGVVQNTKYNCPSEYPHCIGYKCGETWGKCSETSDKEDNKTE